MASTANSAATALQRHRPRPSVNKPIVPAIPLPYVQKRKQHVAQPPKAEPMSGVQASIENHPTPTATAEAIKSESPVDTTTTLDEITTSTAELSNGVVLERSKPSISDEPSVISSSSPEQQPSKSPSMQPPSQPTPVTMSPVHSANAVRLPRPLSISSNPHHPQPGVAGLMFGAYPDSSNSSPAPISGASPQAPNLVTDLNSMPCSGTPQTLSNGQSPMVPQGFPGFHPHHEPRLSQGVSDHARRQIISFAPPDGYSPSVTPGADGMRMTYDPTTPHSFHGSQSSAPHEQDPSIQHFHNHYSRPNGSNGLGLNGHMEDGRLYHQPRPGKQPPPTQAMGHHYAQPSMVQQPPMDNLDGLVGYLQSQFGDASFADYTLELRYADDRAEPVRIPGHNLLFARSPTLKHLMTIQARDANTTAFDARTLLIESNDRFLRSDGFWLAARRLYGGPLLDHGGPALTTNMSTKSSASMSGTPTDRFDLALGYAAAGNILAIPPVINRGIEIAIQFVNWLTLEKALDFALDGGLDSQWVTDTREVAPPPTYGPAVNMLISSAVDFIINSFPVSFELDTTVSSSIHSRRLPLVTDSRSGLHDPRLSFIRFGDHANEEPDSSTGSPSITAILSRVLLELPFSLLKSVLESPRLGPVQGWAAAPLRLKVMTTVIEERERRRMRVHNCRIPNSERTAHHRLWEPVGFQESVVMEEIPVLQRKWVGFVTPDN